MTDFDKQMEMILYHSEGFVLEEDELEFKDYREIILSKNEEEYKKWKDGKNVLYKTLVYELSHFKDVESFPCVKEDFKLYCENFKEEYETADIMNGWWYCFKFLFNVKGAPRKSKNMKNILTNIQMNIKDMTNEEVATCNNEYNVDVYRSFLKFLSVVYTAGNITPAPINPAEQFAPWEYKLDKYKGLYHDYKGDKDKLFFQDYYEYNLIKKNCTTKDFKRNPKEYFDSRVALIIKRGYRIQNKTLTNTELNEIIKKLNRRLFEDSLTS